MKTSQLIVSISTLAFLMIQLGCGKQATGPVRDQKEQAALDSAGWSPMMPDLRSAARGSDRPDHQDSDLGFRLCLAPVQSSTDSKANSGS